MGGYGIGIDLTVGTKKIVGLVRPSIREDVEEKFRLGVSCGTG